MISKTLVPAGLLGALFVWSLAGSAHAAVFTVDNAGDGADITPGDGVCQAPGNFCTLRAAIQEANALAGTDTIQFNIAPAGPKTIAPGSAFPAITSVVIIDGTTQPGFVAAPPFAPVIEINAAGGGANTFSLQFGSSGSTIRGLTINRAPGRAIRLLGTSNNVIAGNFLGTDLTGTAAGPGNQVGVYIGGSGVATNGNRIGGTLAADRNIISGNTVDGIQINGGTGGAANNVVEGNYIGVDVNGTTGLANATQGVALFVSTGTNTNNRIGGTSAAARNVISGNGNDGILIANAGTTGTMVQGNRIGTNANGTAAIPNLRGIEITAGANGSTIGGPVGSDNLISGNTVFGVVISASNNNVVSRSLIGTDAAGTAKIGNGLHGVELSGGASNNTIGGVTGTGNVISGNIQNGINIFNAGTSNNSVLGNIIGLDINGTAVLSNGAFGVAIAQSATLNVIGNATGRNIISGNDLTGVRIVDNATDNNRVENNFIGVDITGALPMPNLAGGVILDTGGAATGNQIGSVGLGNVISGNGGVGIRILNGMTGTLVVDNIIGRDATDTGPVGNNGGGVQIQASSGNTVGGTAAGAGNLIGSNSGGDGVAIVSGTMNAVLGNAIFSNGGLGIDLANNGVTANDLDDPDTGANDLQNFPVLTGATTDGAAVIVVAGSLDSAASTTYRVEFFAGSAPDPTGHGEGRRYLGFQNVATDPSGNASFGATLSALVTPGEFVTATATDPSNNTSELGANITATAELVVTTTADTVDGTTTNVSSLLADIGPDNHISLREAIQATNGTPGADSIRFAIPVADAGHRYYRDDSVPSSLTTVATTTLADADITDFDPDYPAGFTRSWYRIRPSPALDAITDAVTIDAETQPGFITGAPVIELDGSGGGGTTGLSLTTGPGTLRGFVIHGFSNQAMALRGATSGHAVTGNYLGTDVSGTAAIGNGAQGIFIGEIGGAASTIGGSSLATRNIISGNGTRGIFFWAFGAPGISSQIRIQGNFIGTDVTGTIGLGAQSIGIVAEFSGGHLIGGSGAGEGNVISGNTSRGIELNGNQSGSGTDSDGSTIESNLIGTDVTGTVAIGNGERGIIMFAVAPGSVSNNVIRGNVIAASAGGWDGVWLNGNGDGNLFDSNFIGTDTGASIDLGNTGGGILIQTSGADVPTGNTITGNVIRFNDLDGIRILGTGATATITQNQIWDNDALGIDLADDGVTGLDGGDVDVGPNDLMNWPFIYRVIESGGTLTVDYSLDLVAASYRIEFFRNAAGDPSGNGEGRVFAGTTNITHAGAGFQTFSHSFPGAVGDVVTATTTLCTDGATCAAFGGTSEFSNTFIVGTTAVELTSFDAFGRDGAVELEWETSSEIDNLGFHLYRATDAGGPFERITAAVIPGLGSSAAGRRYAHRDENVTAGVRYYYELEDIETTGSTERHGPASAVPTDGNDDDTGGTSRVSYGDPEQVSVRVLERGERTAVIELVTGGFYATRAEGGGYVFEIPDFETSDAEGLPALPLRRLWLDAVAGRDVQVSKGRAAELMSIDGLRPVAATRTELVADAAGTVRAGTRKTKRAWRGTGTVPERAARLVETGYQQDTKKALVELAPLRWDADSGTLLWARRLKVRVRFAGVERSRHRARRSHRARDVLARLATAREGAHRVRFEDAMPGRRRFLRADALRLTRLGEDVPYHIEPRADRFGRGSTLYFLSPGDAAFELVRGTGGLAMPVADDAPAGPVLTAYVHRHTWEEDRYYQPGLLDAPDRWLWEPVLSSSSKELPFTAAPDGSTGGELELRLQGASDFDASPDHHVRISVNGTLVSETSWDGKAARTIAATVPPGVLRFGDNDLSIENVGDTDAAYSMVFVDRFTVSYQRSTSARDGRLDGVFHANGTAVVGGLTEPEGVVVLQRTPEIQWVGGHPSGTDSVSFAVEAGREYTVAAPSSVPEPTVTLPGPSRLRRTKNRADYLVVAPRAFLSETRPLLERRRRQGLRSRAVAIEAIYDEFGYGEKRPEALRDFLEYAYHHWRKPSIRYVVLVGDATFDPDDRLGTGAPDHVPTLTKRTSYLWTASDPSFAAVNGDDALPDLALGRLPAKTTADVRVLVRKILAYEDAEQRLSGTAVLVADGDDAAGSFARDSDAVAEMLDGRVVERIYLDDLGTEATRRAIVDAFDRGPSLVSYAGHGGISLWASESIFSNSDVEGLSPQPRQPIVLTMNCLNGYFHFPYFDALAESLVKAESKGAIAAFAPSGLSLNTPAHVYHRALVTALSSGRHERLGDAVLDAQRAYSASGFFPELLSIYHLFGDPALVLR